MHDIFTQDVFPLLLAAGPVSYVYAVFVATLTMTTNNCAQQEYKQLLISLEWSKLKLLALIVNQPTLGSSQCATAVLN